MIILKANNLFKTYKNGDVGVTALNDVCLSVEQGDLIVIIGKSGSGKSTLLDSIGGIEKPDRGEVLIDGISLYGLKEAERAKTRSLYIGYIFQTFNLIDEFTVLQNVRLPLDISGKPYEPEFEEAIFSALDIKSRLKFYPNQLSGGERQRVAIARALLMRPKIVLADEPTGNLDSQNGQQFMELVKKANTEFNQTFVIVTHDLEWLKIAQKVYLMKDGTLGEYNENKSKFV